MAKMALVFALPAVAEVRMVMVEQHGCIYCARWDKEIAPVWPKTEEGRAAPLRRVDLNDLPDDIAFESTPRLTPTFVLTIDGVEAGRLTGYTGDLFFWPLVRDVIEEAGVPLGERGASVEAIVTE